MELIGHLSEWQFNCLSNKDAFKLTVVIPNNLLFSAMVGLEIRSIAKLNHDRTEGLLTDGKEGWRGKNHFWRRDVSAEVKARGGERGTVYSCTIL